MRERVFDDDTVFILGGNKEPKENSTDTQKSTTFYKVKDKCKIVNNIESLIFPIQMKLLSII